MAARETARQPAASAPARIVPDGYVVVVAPFLGAETTVPVSILDALKASGYVEK